MSLQDTINAGVAQAFSTAASLDNSVACTLIRVTNSEYDPDTMRPYNTTENDTFTGILVRYKRREIDGKSIKREDQKLLIQASELTLPPELEDEVQIAGVRWDIKDVQTPNSAIHICQIRKAP